MRYIYLLFVIFTFYISFSFIYELVFKDKTANISKQPEVITYLASLKKGVIKSSVLELKTQNKISGIDTQQGTFVDRTTGKKYIYQFRIQIDSEGKQVYLNFPPSYIKENKLTIFVPKGSGYIKGGISDLKIGDTILIERLYNYDVTGKLIIRTLSTKITKLNT